MSDRTPATDKGTADRIEADDGGYWVRLVTKQALKREGVCMGNCLDSGDYGSDHAGNEDMVSDGFWSLRKADGLSYLLVEIDTMGEGNADIEEALGPKNSQPSGWSIRQLRHLVAAFRAAGATLRIPENIALTGEDGRTWRPDKAPQAVKDAIEAKRKAEADRRKAEAEKRRTYEISYGQIMARPAGSTGPFRVLGNVAVEGAPPPEARNAGADLADAMRQGLVTSYARDELGGGAVTVRPPGRVDEILTPNGDGTHTLRVGNYTFPRVVPTGDVGIGPDDMGTVTFRIAPERQERPVRVMRTLNGGFARLVEPWLARPWTEAPEKQAASEVRSGIEVDRDERPVAYHVPPARDRAAIVADIDQVEEALMGGVVSPTAAMNRLRGLHRELAQVDGRPLSEGSPRFIRTAPMSFRVAQAALEMLQGQGDGETGEAA